MGVKFFMNEKYIAHFDEQNKDRIQTVSSHNRGVAFLAENNCPLDYLRSIAWLTGIFHDCGKYHDEFDQYIHEAMEEKAFVRRKVTHSTAGGLLADGLLKNKFLSEFIQYSIYSHHGVNDCFCLDSGESLIKRRKSNMTMLSVVSERFYQYIEKEKILNYIEQAEQDFQKIQLELLNFIKFEGRKNSYGNVHFFLGLYERILLSLLIDSDRFDTNAFAENKPIQFESTGIEIEDVWEESILNLESKLSKFEGAKVLDQCRSQISDQCRRTAERSQFLYRLTVPTGAGKTLSSLRFALYHAKKFGREHIIYVAPYNSILEQNAETIRDAVGNQQTVLEHHSNVIIDSEDTEKQKKYQTLTERWDSPIIVTTAVQLLNTLFSSKTESVRRMYRLCNSVIIFDEIQALPVRITELFNLAVNFLTTFCNTTIVLCSATQPLFDQLPSNRLLPVKNMVETIDDYKEAFKRTVIIDKTEEDIEKGWDIEKLGDFVTDLLLEKGKVLVIVNTKKTAQDLYDLFSNKYEEDKCYLFHLSTNMCPQNRKETLDFLKVQLTNEKNTRPILCISTQVIEAGVDISFPCVVRSLAGLDNIIQAAGRCNRNGEIDIGQVYIVQMSEEAERISKQLRDIKIAQDTMRKVLYQYRRNPATLNYSLESKQALELYYKLFMSRRFDEMQYLVSIKGKKDTSLIELLSSNCSIWQSFHKEQRLHLKQAFKTAGDQFEVIENQGKINVIVEYDETAKKLIDYLQDETRLLSEKKQDLRNLQPYIVGISKQMIAELGKAISPTCDNRFFVLSENYYSKKTGVSTFPVGMDTLMI